MKFERNSNKKNSFINEQNISFEQHYFEIHFSFENCSLNLTYPNWTLLYFTLPNLTLPYLTLPYLTLPYLTLPMKYAIFQRNDPELLRNFIWPNNLSRIKLRFTRLAHYSLEFGEASHIFLKKAFGECWWVWRVQQMSPILMNASLASHKKSQKLLLWQVLPFAKFANFAKFATLSNDSEMMKRSVFHKL